MNSLKSMLIPIATLILCQCSTSNNNSFIDEKYNGVTPIAQLINMPVYANLSDSFSIEKEQDIQVYAIGEILFNLSDWEKKYYLANDDIELFFKTPIPKTYILNYKGSKDLEKIGITFRESTSEPYHYIAEIKISFTDLGIHTPQKNLTIPFDIQIGDNDDGLVQKAKLAWVNNSDRLNTLPNRYGTIQLSNDTHSLMSKDTIQSSFRIPLIDGEIDTLWNNIPVTRIEKNVYGFVKDKYDLAASMRSTWDKDYIYFLVEIDDSRRKQITKKKINERNIFVDYGWIENDKGERIWEMNAKYSTWAGGAYRNQKIDTILHLMPGKYVAHYISDESHSYNDWVDLPPKFPFYGMFLYEVQ